MNFVGLTGNIATDIELRDAGQSRVTQFNLAVKNPFKKDDTDFIAIEAWNKTAELLEQYCGKGSKIGVEGTIKVDQFQDKEGNNRKITKVNANRIEFLDTKSQNQGTQQQNANTGMNPQDQQKQPAQGENGSNPFENADGPVDLNDEDLPF